jgi:hypothetical protein
LKGGTKLFRPTRWDWTWAVPAAIKWGQTEPAYSAVNHLYDASVPPCLGGKTSIDFSVPSVSSVVNYWQLPRLPS